MVIEPVCFIDCARKSWLCYGRRAIVTDALEFKVEFDGSWYAGQVHGWVFSFMANFLNLMNHFQDFMYLSVESLFFSILKVGNLKLIFTYFMIYCIPHLGGSIRK